MTSFLQEVEPTVSSKQALRVHAETWLKKKQGLDSPLLLAAYRNKFKEDLENYLVLNDELPENEVTPVKLSTRSVADHHTKEARPDKKSIFDLAVFIFTDGLEKMGVSKQKVSDLNTTLKSVDLSKFDRPAEFMNDIRAIFQSPQVKPIATHKKWSELFTNFLLLIGYIATAGIAAGVVKCTTDRFFPETSVQKQIREFERRVDRMISSHHTQSPSCQ